MALSTLSALLLRRRRAKAATHGRPPAAAVTVLHRNATVHIGSGSGQRRRGPPLHREDGNAAHARLRAPDVRSVPPAAADRRRRDGGHLRGHAAGAEGFRRLFVIKRLRPEMARNRTAVEQFIDEAKLGASLVHPNIVPVFDFGKVGDEYFMAQEFILGRDVARLLQRQLERNGRPLDEKLMLYVAHEVLDALAYAHTQSNAGGTPLGLVHRDVSPDNIMVTARGEVKLFDFGIVKAIGRIAKSEEGVVKGNIAFMSPEQARSEPVDAQSDLFSLGLVVYNGITNERLYRTDDGSSSSCGGRAWGHGSAAGQDRSPPDRRAHPAAGAHRRSGAALSDRGGVHGGSGPARRRRQARGRSLDAAAVRGRAARAELGGAPRVSTRRRDRGWSPPQRRVGQDTGDGQGRAHQRARHHPQARRQPPFQLQ